MTSRRRDHLFPRVHPRPATGWVNDPNGPIFAHGRWHLFFQHRYTTPPIAPVTWGHASSDDLAHWELHRSAITPQPGSADADGVWSGNTVLHDGRIVAFYSGSTPESRFQPPLRADSADEGWSFGPPRATAPLPDDAERIDQLRDPFVWREGDGWRMVLGQGDQDGRPGVRLAASDDLETWRTVGLLAGAEPGSTGAGLPLGSMWECPQVADLDGRRLVFLAVMGDGVGYAPDGSGFGPVIALVGEQGDAGLGDYAVQPVDHGDAFYAPSLQRDGAAGPLLWGWLTESRDDSWWTEEDWAGMLSLPRTVGIADDGRPTFAPAAELVALRHRELPIGDDGAPVPAAFELEVEIGDAPVRVELSTSAGERAVLTVDPVAGVVELDRSAASTEPRAVTRPIRFDDDGLRGTFRLFVDGSSWELFTASGRAASVRIYPTAPPPWTVTVAGGAARAWELG